MEKDVCYRCGTNLIFSKDSNGFLYSKCEKCGYDYVKENDKPLIEGRKDSSFAFLLYPIIFETKKISKERIKQIATNILEYDINYIKILIEDIDEELIHPKRKLIDLLNLNGSEDIARDYLGRLSMEIKYQLKSTKNKS